MAPNILFLMTDQMQARVLDPDHPCITPNFDRLAARGVRFRKAYTPNAVCSPARASLMTGLLPHNHGVLEVTHVVDDDQCILRLDKPHWAMRLADLGYRTGYFGKWHVERSEDLNRFGWEVDGGMASALFEGHRRKHAKGASKKGYSLQYAMDEPAGYKKRVLYGVTDQPAKDRGMGLVTSLAAEFLEEALVRPGPWCCFVSVKEPHDPFIAGREAYEQYDVDSLELPPNIRDDLTGRPNLYRKAAGGFDGMTERQKREAAACYFASITEIDGLFGRLIDMVEAAGKLDETIVVLTSDHGELLGAHGLYCKNVSAFEEVYNIPLVMAGPGIAQGESSDARVGLHDLCPTLLELAGAEPIASTDARSVADVARDPIGNEGRLTDGYAEYHGGRYRLTQRVVWDGPWKYVHNGFDFDELYNLDDDPYEMNNLAGDPAHRDVMSKLVAQMWTKIRETGDRALLNTHYPVLRLAPSGPLGR